MLELRRAFRDGTTHLRFDPPTFLERLAALIPRPRVHLFTYRGVLAPAAKWRDQVIPEPPIEEETGDELERKRRGEPGDPQDTARASRWVQLMKRVFDMDVLVCEHCGGKREVIAFLTETRVVHLAHLGLPTESPPIAPARPPPELEPLFA